MMIGFFGVGGEDHLGGFAAFFFFIRSLSGKL
jgi:hypothetical protein